MNRIEYVLAASLLRVVGWLALVLPRHPRRVVIATARTTRLEGNLAFIHAAIRRLRPDVECVLLLEPYGYGFGAKLRYAIRLVRGMVQLRTAGLVVVDNAWLPIHVAPHPGSTTVVQVWHAVGALKRFGADTTGGLVEPERTFLHRYYDHVVCAGESDRVPYAAALRTPVERVLPLGAPRTDFFFDEAAMAAARERVLVAHPSLAGRTVVLCAPTFRGRGRARTAAAHFDGAALRAGLPDEYILVLKSHPNLDPSLTPTTGFDVVAEPDSEINELLVAADVLVTDYSSSIFEWVLLRRPLVLIVADLDRYEADPGLYLDYRTDMIGTQVRDAAAAAAAIRERRFDPSGYDSFIARHLGASDGRASERFVGRFIPS
ncbi:MAG: CDP-glycerol glycerophosphotransferase family protein [Candidatus Limnocylindrales bacterium]